VVHPDYSGGCAVCGVNRKSALSPVAESIDAASKGDGFFYAWAGAFKLNT